MKSVQLWNDIMKQWLMLVNLIVGFGVIWIVLILSHCEIIILSNRRWMWAMAYAKMIASYCAIYGRKKKSGLHKELTGVGGLKTCLYLFDNFSTQKMILFKWHLSIQLAGCFSIQKQCHFNGFNPFRKTPHRWKIVEQETMHDSKTWTKSSTTKSCKCEKWWKLCNAKLSRDFASTSLILLGIRY